MVSADFAYTRKVSFHEFDMAILDFGNLYFRVIPDQKANNKGDEHQNEIPNYRRFTRLVLYFEFMSPEHDSKVDAEPREHYF